MGGTGTTENRIENVVAPVLEAMGYNLVRIMVFGGARSPTLQIMAERHDDKGMTVDDCAAISRAVSPVLDVEDPVAGAYTLQVSSPGIDRPLVRLEDYARFAGDEARIETSEPVDGRKRFRGRLMGVDGDQVLIELEDGTCSIPHRFIQRAKLVLTDELLARAAAQG